MKPTQKILIATGNRGKAAELREMFTHLAFDLASLSDFESIEESIENGKTFAENARIKAIHYSINTGLMAIADDSGLEVVALNGAPGIYSQRFAGAASPYDVKITALLDAIVASGNTDRSARFVCSMAIASPDGDIRFEADGVCDGTIAASPVGKFGFGYDPIFVPSGFDKTFGELGDIVKQQISHRARAAAKIMRFLRDYA